MIHQYQYNGKKFGLRVLNKDGTSFGGFKNSVTPGDIITCPNWEPTNKCGNGLHFWPWGHGRKGKEFAGDKLWQVVEYEECVPLEGKAKAPWLKVIFTGNEAECMKILLPGLIAYLASESEDSSSASNSRYYSSANNSGECSLANNSGNYSSASNSGYRSSASNSGDYSSASNSGNCSSASNSGYRSSASNSGDYSSASNSGNCSSASNSGHRSSASNSGFYSSAKTCSINSIAANTGIKSKAECGDNSVAVCIDGMVKGGKNSMLVLGYNTKKQTLYKSLATLPNGTLKSNTWYKLNSKRQFVEVKDVL